MAVTILTGDCRVALKGLPAESVHCAVTSPPYYSLRDYGCDGQIGIESSVEEYVAELVNVFREVKRVLRPDATLWLNLGDSFKDKQLQGAPWRVAFALQADGWYLRSDIVWHKPAQMPESVKDRPTRAHEYLFLLAKNERYYFDADAVKEDRSLTPGALAWAKIRDPAKNFVKHNRSSKNISNGHTGGIEQTSSGRNIRSVWTIPTQPFSAAKFGLDVDHFATFPPKLVEPCIKAGCPEGGTVLDPFGGAGTVGLVSQRLNRNATLVELNPDYAALARARIDAEVPPLLAGVAA